MSVTWRRVPEGWAVNLDGTDAARVFALPRVEVRSSPGGWLIACFNEDGSRSGGGVAHSSGLVDAKQRAIAEAARGLPERYRERLREVSG
jgi:hypothetical protein